MSATEILRRLLDERGVEYDTDDEDGCEFTEWVANGLEWEADSRGELVSLMPVMLITPEQAIAATLGSCNCTNSERTGTCHNASKVVDEHGQARFACSECGAWIDSRMLWNPEYRNGESPWVRDCKLNFCPNCGCRIVGPTTNDVDEEVTDG